MEQALFQHKVEEAISATKALIAEYRELTRPIAPDDAIGRVSRMDAINNKSVNEAALRQAESKLASLKRVLASIGNEDFGLCLQCRKPIPEERILIRPESLYCVQCAR